MYKFSSSIFFSMLIVIQMASACSTFYINYNNKVIFGNNYDWDLEDGLIIVNKRGVKKKAINSNNPAQWTSKYGSVTFNQYGRGFPTGGMNEAGLTVGLMWLDESEYPPPDSRSEIDNMQWIQYLLDNFSTVEEVIASDTALRVAPLSPAAIHYLIGDAQGGCVSIEFIGGKRVCSVNNDMPVKALTNNTYAEATAFLKMYRGFGGQLPIPKRNGSLERFVRIAYMIKEYHKQKSKDISTYGFDILSTVAMDDYTKWSIIYDLKNRIISFRTYSRKQIKKIDLKTLDFSCKTPVNIIDINTKSSGDINNKFISYSPKINKKLIKSTFTRTYFLRDISKELLKLVYQYPESLACE